MAGEQRHKHHLTTMLNLVASLKDPAEDDPGGGVNHGQFKDNFGELILSSLPDIAGEGRPSSSYLNALSAISPESALGGTWQQNEISTAIDDLQRKIVLYHLANLELLSPTDPASPELQQRHWDGLLQQNTALIPTDTFTYNNLTDPGEMHTKSTALSEAARLHGPQITRDMAKVCRSFHPDITESRQPPVDSIVFHCQDDITSARDTHPVTLLSERISNLSIPPCPFTPEVQRPLMLRLKNLILLMLISSSMASIAQAVLLLRAATLVATARCDLAIQALKNFGPSATLANLNDQITLANTPMSKEYRDLIKSHSAEFTVLKRALINAAAEMRQLLLNKDACASLTLHRMLCGSGNYVNFSTLLGSLLFLSRTDRDMVSIMNTLQQFANTGFASEGTEALTPIIGPIVKEAEGKFAGYWGDTSACPTGQGLGTSATGVGVSSSSYAFNVLQKALSQEVGRAKKLAEEGQLELTTNDAILCNLSSLRDSIDANIINLDAHLMARNNEHCPVSVDYSTTRSSYQESVRESILSTISRLQRAKVAADAARSNRDTIFAHTAPRWESMQFSGYRKDWVPFRREFTGLFRDFQGDDIYVMRQLVSAMQDEELKELVREKDSLEEAMDFLERRFCNADDEVTRLLAKFETIPKPVTKQQELSTYLKLESLKRRLAKAGGDDLMSRFATRKFAENVLHHKVWEKFMRKQSDIKTKKRNAFLTENGDFTEEKVITLQNNNERGLNLTHNEAYNAFWDTVKEAILFLENTGYVADIDKRIFVPDNAAGDRGNGGGAYRGRGNRRRGAFNNLTTSQSQNNSQTWGGAADAAFAPTRGNGLPPTKPPKQVQSGSGAGAAKAPRTPPTCRLKPCQDLGGQAAQHTLFLCLIVQGTQSSPAPINKLLRDSGVCVKCARYLSECGGNCNGQYLLRNGTSKSGLCQEGCGSVNRMFCAHSKLYNSPKNKFKGTPQNLAAMHTAGVIINDMLHYQEYGQADVQEITPPPTSANLSWTVAATLEPIAQAFDILNTTPLNQDPFRDNSQLTDIIKVCANTPGALVYITRVLYDSGADVSYLCSAFARQLGLRPIDLPKAFDLPTAGGGYSLVTHYYLLKIIRDHDEDVLIKVHGVDDLSRRYSAMHLSVPREVLKQFNVQPSHFTQASRPISLILGSDVWRYLSPVELKRTSDYLLYRSVINNNLLLAGARRSTPQSTISQCTLLALNNLHSNNNDLFQQEKDLDTSIAKLQHKLGQATAPPSLVSNRQYLDLRERQSLGATATQQSRARAQVPLHPLASEYTGRSRRPWPVLQQSGVIRPRDLRPSLSRSKSRPRRNKTVTFNKQVLMHTPLNNIVTIPLEDDKYTLGMVAFHQGSPMSHTGSLYSMQVRGDMWAHDNSAPVKGFFEKYGVSFNVPFAPIRDCEKCSRPCEECKVLSSKLDPSSLVEYTLFYKQTKWSEEERKWFCDPVYDHKKLQLLGDGSKQVMHRMFKLDEKVARLEVQDRDSLNDCVNKAMDCGALKIASDLPMLEGLQKGYIPMGYVCSNSSSTPVRAVWDNGHKANANGVSLNDCQLTGPNLCSLFRCACYIRSFRFFSSLDIRKSFWNLHTGPISMSLHRVFMKVAMVDGVLRSVLGHKAGAFTEYVMSTLSFGDKAATAHLAVAIAKGLVKFGVDEQLARQLLLFVYVDNAHLASNDLEELKEWERQTDRFFADMNWATHSWIRSYDVEPAVTTDHSAPENSIVKLLGVYHDIPNDKFFVTFAINLGKISRNKKLASDLQPGEDPLQYILLHGMSRRTALRVSGSIFCYSGHCITLQVASRLCFRQTILWNPQASWDQQLTLQTKQMYSELFKNILACSGHSWDRCWIPKDQEVEQDGIHPYLVAHCDGSLVASATKIFIVSKPVNSKRRQVSLVCARAQVAPVKQLLSVPQLELNSIWLAARAVEEIKQNFEIRLHGAVILTDSETSFHWSQASPNFLAKFPANKVKVIQSILDIKKIFHIASRFNLADTPSKYQPIITKETMTAEMEPGFMTLHRSEWPTVRLTPSSKDLPDVLDKYRGMGVDIFSQPALAIMPQTTCQAGENPKHVVQAFNLEPRLMSLQSEQHEVRASSYQQAYGDDSQYQDPDEAMNDYRLNFAPDYHCDVVMPEETSDRFLAAECLDFHQPDHCLNNLLHKGFKPMVHEFLARKGKDEGKGWLKHAWAEEIPQIKESMSKEDPEYFAELLLSHTSLNKVIRIVALCIRFGRRCRGLEGRDEEAPLQKHFITAHMLLHRMATPKVKYHLSNQVLSERFFLRDGILRVFNRRFKNRDTNFAETSIVLSARTALGICTLLDCHYRRGGHLCSPLSITSKLRADTPSIYMPFATKLLQSIEAHCTYCRMKKMETARPVQGMVASGQTATRTIFKHVVLDGAGPWLAVRGEGAKQEQYRIWCYLWSCLSTGLLHITVAEDLTAAQVILGLSEVNSTYGQVKSVHCDGQSAFQKLARLHSEAKDLVPEDERRNAAITTLEMEALRRHGLREGVTFNFGAPRAAHFQSAAELSVGALKRILYMESIAGIAPEMKKILQKSGEKEEKYELVETILDSSGLTLLQYQALWKRIAAKLNRRPWHHSESGPYSRWDLLHPRDDEEGTNGEIMEPVMLDKSDKAYSQLQIIEGALAVVWERYTAHLITHLAKGEQARWPSLDANDFKPGTLVLFKDRVLKQGRLDLGVVQELIQPTPGDAQRRYLVRSAHKRHKSAHPRPLAADTVAHSILERDASSLIRLGHVDDRGPLFFDPAVLRDDHTPEQSPSYPGQDGGAQPRDDPPLVYATRKSKDQNRFGKKHTRAATPVIRGRASTADERTAAERESGLLPLYSMRQDLPQVQGQEVQAAEPPTPTVQAADPPDQAAAQPAESSSERLYAADGQAGEDNAASLLPRDMSPPPELSEILTPVATPGDGHRLFAAVACSMLLQREKVDHKRIPARRRSSITKLIRKQAFQQAIALTFKPESKEIFGFMLEEGQEVEEMIAELREVLESFIDKEKQQAVPSRFSEQFSQLSVIFPHLLAMAIGSPIFIFTLGSTNLGNLERVDGYRTVLGKEETHPAVVIKFDGLAYDAMTVMEGYEEIFKAIQDNMSEEDSYVPQDTIQRAIHIVHYLSQHNSTREYV